MKTNLLRQKILNLAIRGKLVPQDPNDEPAFVLLERIRAEKEHLIAEGKIKRSKKPKASSADNGTYQNGPYVIHKSVSESSGLVQSQCLSQRASVQVWCLSQYLN